MKITSVLVYYIIPLNLLLCASFCCPPEDDYIDNSIYIEKDALISIENNTTNFVVGDTVFIETNIENNQTTRTNENVILSDYFYEDLSKSIKLRYNFNLYKDSNFGSLVTIPVDIEFIEVFVGNITTNTESSFSYISVENIFDNTFFKSKFGIVLKEKGTFYLSSVELNYNGIITITGGDYNKGFINIDTKIKNADANGLYKFIVD